MKDDRGSERRGGGRRDNGGSRRGSGGDRGGFRRTSSYNRLPREQGMIVSLLDSFGFIKCAEREEDVFFHFSEVERNTHPSDLMTGMEVDFDIGPSPQSNSSSNKQDQKLAAFRVNVLPEGTVKWELPDEDEPVRKRGHVEKVARVNHSRTPDIRSSPYDGTIRLVLSTTEISNETEQTESSSEKIIIGYSLEDYISTKNQSSRLARNDLLEFTTVIDRRSKKKIAKNIQLIQSERDRQRELKEQKMLAEATLERGVVVTLNQEDGYLRSSLRHEYIYFQYSHVDLPDDEHDQDSEDNPNSNKKYTLAIDQDMEFLVCKEEINNRNNHTHRLSARKIKFLPKGTVQFYESVSKGVLGYVSTVPVPKNSNRNNVPLHQIRGGGGTKGTIQLKHPISVENDKLITNISLHMEFVPGGIYAATRDGSQLGLWIREGDLLLFDVVKEILDGSYCAQPTRYLLPNDVSDKTSSHQTGDTEEIRLLQPSLAGRAQGVVSAIKDGYGFITFTERNTDIYFRLYEIFPTSIQASISRFELSSAKDKKSDHPSYMIEKFMIGSQVTFDSIMSPSGPQDQHPRGKGKHHGSENLKGQRVYLLPKASFSTEILIAKDVRALVKQEHRDKSGLLELETPITAMSREVRHPLISALLDYIVESGKTIVYPTVLVISEAVVVISMAEQRGLNVDFVDGTTNEFSPDPLINGYAKLRISNPAASANSSKGEENEKPKDESSESEALENCDISSVHCAKTDDNATGTTKTLTKRRSARKSKPVKTIRFERGSISRDNVVGLPSTGDIVECSVIQSRRTGAYLATNVKIIDRKLVERKPQSPDSLTSVGVSGTGLVTEVVPARDFGFITQMDENGLKKEVLFFHMSSLVAQNIESNNGDTHEKQSRRSRGRHYANIKKGDEVKFDIGKIEKTGKRVALNVTVLPHGTLQIPSKADENACKGIILMEPSHTSLSNTPLHQSTSRNQGGRWADVNESKGKKQSGSHLSEEGLILLFSDPSNQFRIDAKKERSSNVDRSSTKMSEEPTEETKTPDEKLSKSKTSTAESKNQIDPESFLHVKYRSVGVAVRGAGASSPIDAGVAPRRGDLVSFVKGKGSNKTARDIRLVTRSSARAVRGHLKKISLEEETAEFVSTNYSNELYSVNLKEVISCDVKLLNENTEVEGILYEDKIFGVCRTTDLYLNSKVKTGMKERPRLNLTVRKELQDMGGKIVAQSGLASGPDGSFGFARGWTKRVSKFASKDENKSDDKRSDKEENENKDA